MLTFICSACLLAAFGSSIQTQMWSKPLTHILIRQITPRGPWTLESMDWFNVRELCAHCIVRAESIPHRTHRGLYSKKTTSKGDRNKQAALPTYPIQSHLEQAEPGHCLPHTGSTGHGEYHLVTPLTSSHSLFCLTQNLHKHTTHQSRTQHVFRSKRLKKRTKLESSALRGVTQVIFEMVKAGATWPRTVHSWSAFLSSAVSYQIALKKTEQISLLVFPLGKNRPLSVSTASPTTFWRHRYPNCQFSRIIRTWGGREHTETNFCKPCNFQFIFSLLLVFWILESLRWPKTFTEPKAQTKLLTRSLWLTK